MKLGTSERKGKETRKRRNGGNQVGQREKKELEQQ